MYWPTVGRQPLFDHSTQLMEEGLKGQICKLGLTCVVRLWETLCCADFLSDSCSEVLKSKCTQWAKVSAKGPPSKGEKFVGVLELNFIFDRIDWFSKLIWWESPETWWISKNVSLQQCFLGGQSIGKGCVLSNNPKAQILVLIDALDLQTWHLKLLQIFTNTPPPLEPWNFSKNSYFLVWPSPT